MPVPAQGPPPRVLLAAVALLVTAAAAAAAAADHSPDTAREVTPEVAAAAERGLSYLAHTQLPAGAWAGDVGFKRLQGYEVLEAGVPHVGVTALCALAFLAGGHLPGRNGPHGPLLERATAFLLDAVNDFGFIGGRGTRMYSHAFATLYLAEIHGMVQVPGLEEKLQRAVDLIVAAQNADGSWRYQPFTWESDMSVTVCQLMALRAARGAGLHVPATTIDRAVRYVEHSRVPGARDAYFQRPPAGYYRSATGAFRYQVDGDRRSSFALTAAGVTSLYHASRYRPDLLRESLAFLEETQRLLSRSWTGHYFYYYGHYYAVQAMFLTGRHQGSGHDFWGHYWTRTSRELLAFQDADGSWRNEVGPGRAFGTAVACIVLQTPYQYLPILQR